MNHELRIKNKKGFTLIELLVAFVVIAVLSTIGIASFVSYSRSQALTQATNDLATTLTVARSRAQAQVKPSTGVCQNSPLLRYDVRLCGIGTNFCVNTNEKGY